MDASPLLAETGLYTQDLVAGEMALASVQIPAISSAFFDLPISPT
jgi:hypothetical protein